MTDHRDDLLKGTLDLLILKTLELKPMHGWGIAERIQLFSDDVLHVPTGSLYPALQRLLRKGLIVAEWRQTENNRRARYYRLGSTGRKQLKVETESWNRTSVAINRVLHASL
ncbi:MAG: PadR family transcriptional regulator [Gemmatimonadales bacterium]|nr:PadR family transcriptional regulator [Gemmatimonadales bacterium]NIN10717.1 PadR family transcriptional regulator [Gemmatimonadales bacterium]NIN49429.1 PadR family transcriptional regulator [Gemmatimonadales bacterium]NIP06893.1 PadR family transcriptional regulator [Gemmatimonadales bacterium]NIR01576.1 PadR family transcriptional regulator [Gemmatimonadales bacterium]